MCAENTQRLPSSEEAIVAPSVTRQHTTSNARNRKCKNRGENDPKSRQHLHTRRASCGRVAMSARDASPRPAVAKSIHADHCANTYVCVLEKRKKEEHRKAHQDGKRHSWMAAIHAVWPKPQQSHTVAAHTYPQKTKQKENKKS
ncbi:hypothetical protein TcCL_ESM06298 [Trypanosoma cruzi]|nr:hypothetical protein TcCL_ESM06298 [Trypanosoma cruzi]